MEIIAFSKLLHSMRQYSKVLLNWQSGITYLFCLLGLLLFEFIPLRFLQLFLNEIIAKIQQMNGYEAFTFGTYYYIDGYWSEITKECTYMDLFFLTAPFLVRKTTILNNLVRLSLYLTVIFSLNLIRLLITDYLLLAGLSWKLGHDLIDHFIYYGILINSFLVWARARFLQKKEEP